MKLLTHNFLTSRCIKGVTVGYPLQIIVNEVKDLEVDFNSEFVARMIPKVEWPALRQAAENVGKLQDLPETVPEDYDVNEEFLKKAHHVMLEVEVVNGELVCPETGRKFPITDGIPNMLVNEDEV
nr:EOG090X0LTV [Triops cancriformis]